jgi:hypothetical protein
MNSKVSILYLSLWATGCTAQTPPTAVTAHTAPSPMKIIRTLPASPPAYYRPDLPSVLPPAQVCRLGTNCLSMDSHPFEPCLVSDKRCDAKLAEVIRVERKVLIRPAPR